MSDKGFVFELGIFSTKVYVGYGATAGIAAVCFSTTSG